MVSLVPVTAAQLIAAPIGRYTRGEHFLFWCSRVDLCGLAVWGRPDVGELELLTEIFDRGEGNGLAIPCDFVLDTRRLEGIERDAFDALVRAGSERIDGMRRRIRRHALLRGSGTLGALVAGFYPVLDVEV